MKRLKRWFRRLFLLKVQYIYVSQAGSGLFVGYLHHYVAIPASYFIAGTTATQNGVSYMAIIEPKRPDATTGKYVLLTVEADKVEIL